VLAQLYKEDLKPGCDEIKNNAEISEILNNITLKQKEED
jgi:hypothetical protein